jgi:ribosomal protein S18 acetylase RimI-like enzyme
MHLRRATPADADPVRAFTSDTWPDRDIGDYVGGSFPEWVATDGERRATFVLDAREAGTTGAPDSDDLAGVVRAQLLTDHEGWVQGLRVNPAYRGEGHGARLLDAALGFCAEAGASVARCIVFSWNTPSLGLCRSVGFEPVGQFRWARPTPDATVDPAEEGSLTVRTDDADPDAAWDFWTASDARAALAGVGLDRGAVWAVSELTREDFRAAAGDGRLIAVAGDGVEASDERGGRHPLRATTLRVRAFERESGAGETETVAEYAVGAWTDADAARALLRAAARDAGRVGADRARLPVPESARWVSDAALARVELADDPTFVLAAPLP